MARKTRHVKSRYLILDAVDKACLTLALRDSFPTLRILAGDSSFPKQEPPFVPFLGWPGTCKHPMEFMYHLLFPKAGWEPLVVPAKRKSRFTFLNFPFPHLRFDGSLWGLGGGGRWAFDPPCLSDGLISGNWSDDNEAEKAFLRQVWRILGKLTTNRMQVGHVKSGTVYSGDTRGCEYWAGHHALQWCRGAPRLMLNGLYRPRENWEMPDNPWYRDLIERAGALLPEPLERYLDRYPPDAPPRPEGR